MGERAFNAHLDMAKSFARQMDAINYELNYRNIEASIQNALGMVEHKSVDLVPALGKVEDARRAVLVAMSTNRFAAGDNLEITARKRDLVEAINELEVIFSQCPPSMTATHLGLR